MTGGFIGIALAGLFAHQLSPGADITFRASVTFDGKQANNLSKEVCVSQSGRLLGFSAWASNMVLGDDNGFPDAFVRDVATGRIMLVSVATDGTQGNAGGGTVESISSNDRYATFSTVASNLVPGDTNGVADVFLRDLLLGTTERVSLGNGGVQANDGSALSRVSGDGRFVAFYSLATNLVEGDTNGREDVFVYDRWTETTRRVSVSSTGEQGNRASWAPDMTPDGRFVCFSSYADNLVPGDTNRTQDVFVHDTWTGITERVSVASDGTQGNNSSGGTKLFITPDGRFVMFSSFASNLVFGDTNRTSDTFVHDRWTRTTVRVSVRSDGGQGNHGGGIGELTDDGRYAVFGSASTNLTDDEDSNGTLGDVFMHDLWTRTTWRISESSSGVQGNGASGTPSISSNGLLVAFHSDATNLVANDTNGYKDIFVRVNWSLRR